MTLCIEEKTSDIDGRYLLLVSGEIDLQSAPELCTALTQALQKEMIALSIDLSKVHYIDSSGLTALIAAYQECGQKGVCFLLLNPSDRVVRILHLTCLDTVFTILEDE